MVTRSPGRRAAIACRLALLLVAALAIASPAPTLAQGSPPATQPPPAPKPGTVTNIIGLVSPNLPATTTASQQPPTTSVQQKPQIGLNDTLGIVVTATGPVNAADYVLFLNGRAVDGLTATTYDSNAHALVFRLRRNTANPDVWTALMGSPGIAPVEVSVALGTKPLPNQTAVPTIMKADGTQPVFDLVVLSPWWLMFAVLAVGAVCALVWGSVTRSTILRDNLLPQIAPAQQPYSLGRWQMAFWFTLIFAAFVFLFVLLWDANTISDQALMLMGISGATALAAVAVDAVKDTPVDAANTALRALGLNSYADVVRVQAEIKQREEQRTAIPVPDAATLLLLDSQIRDRRLLLRTYEATIKPFVSEGWFRDLTTDINGSALHRIQVFCWTWILGAVFLIGLYRDLAMPQFSATLLALMGISSAGYIGFKYPEKQN